MNEIADVIDLLASGCGLPAQFFELYGYDPRPVLDYIEEHKMGIRVFEKKWYDVLTKKFYATEIKPDPDERWDITEETSVFDTFAEFFENVRGEIYDRTCFFGYSFSQSEIETYKLDVQKLNFDAFIEINIDDYTCAKLNKTTEAELLAKVRRVKKIAKWIDQCSPITTIEDLESKRASFEDKFKVPQANRVFFSMLVRKYKDEIKELAIEFASRPNEKEGLGFIDVLLTYGPNAARNVLKNYKGTESNSESNSYLQRFKDALDSYDGGSFPFKREFGFDADLYLYFVKDAYANDPNSPLFWHVEYFATFDDFVSFVNGDLRGANLKDAPLNERTIEQCKTDDKTILPLSINANSNRLITKDFVRGKFIVRNKLWGFMPEKRFDHFFDFVHFLNKDLSDADLLLCEGIENLKGIDGLNLKSIKVRSEVAEKLDLPIERIAHNSLQLAEFETTRKHEIATVDNFLVQHPEDIDYSGQVSYVTDIHLPNRLFWNNCKTVGDANFVIKRIAETLCQQATSVNLIGGDTSNNLDFFKTFIRCLVSCRQEGHFFLTLGNHELWPFHGIKLSSIVDEYKKILEEEGNSVIHLVQNNLYYRSLESFFWREIPEEELESISPEELKKKTRCAEIVVFGGIGFSRMNDENNADNGIYIGAIDRRSEIKESKKFLALYEKVTTALKGKNLIILTHMPMKDWGGPGIVAKEGCVYVNGHDHINFFYDDGKERIYADNQIGYMGREVSFKQIPIDFGFDWFADYPDGIHEITKEDYFNFYRGIGEKMSFNRNYEKIFMVKREGNYLFLMKTIKGKMMILSGGQIRKAGDHPLQYFYENMANYSKSVSLYLSEYNNHEKSISSLIRKIGGSGRVHGCIVDIDYYNHVYLNPIDGRVTPYFAYSIVDKYVYDNFPSLLKYKCPKLYENYVGLLEDKHSDSNALILGDRKFSISKKETLEESTEMYKISGILKALQFTTKHNVIRLWNDKLVADASKEKGKMIVAGIINPDSDPQLTKGAKPKKIRGPRSK